MTAISQEASTSDGRAAKPVLQAVNIVKTYGHVVALDGVDLELYPGEVLAVIGDNGAGKSTLIKCLSGAEAPSTGQIMLDGAPVTFKTPLDARNHGIETVYQTLAVSPSLDIAGNLFLGREERRAGPLGSIFRMLDGNGMRKRAKEQMSSLGIGTLQNMGQAVESLSGGQRQAVAVAQRGRLQQQGDHPRRADRRVGREGVRPGAQADPEHPGARHTGHPHLAQHAAGVRGR